MLISGHSLTTYVNTNRRLDQFHYMIIEFISHKNCLKYHFPKVLKFQIPDTFLLQYRQPNMRTSGYKEVIMQLKIQMKKQENEK